MKTFTRTFCLILLLSITTLQSFSQAVTDDRLPKDYLSKEFHAGRRDALRALMPANSVAVVFSYPECTFSNDVTYAYHSNPDLYYFSGYKETSAVLLIFKEMQHGSDGDYNELFFVQHRDPQQEQWTGKRLGVEGVKNKLGFVKVFNSEDFSGYPIDLTRFTVLYDDIPENQGNMKPLFDAFIAKGNIQRTDPGLLQLLSVLSKYANPHNVDLIVNYYMKGKENDPAYKNSDLLQSIISKHDSVSIAAFKAKYNGQFGGLTAYSDATTQLRGVKTSEEMELMRKTVKISALAHAEVMRAISPKMSETEIEGIFLYVHKHYGAEDEGYPPIVGSGANSCILHYEENNAT